MNDKVECLICHKRFGTLQFHLKAIHHVSGSEYRGMFPGAVIMCEAMRADVKKRALELWASPDSPYRTEEYDQKRSKTMKRLREDPKSTFNTDEFIEKHLQGERSPHCRQQKSESIKQFWLDPNSKYNTDEYLQTISQKSREAWADPNSKLNAPDFGKKISASVDREQRSEMMKEQWADPNSAYNGSEYHQKLSLHLQNNTGFGGRYYASDGHQCSSRYELIFEEWLISNNLGHISHPRIPTAKGFADQLVNGHYIEIDGMNRTREYWKEKYKSTGIKPIIIRAMDINSFGEQLNEQLVRKIKMLQGELEKYSDPYQRLLL